MEKYWENGSGYYDPTAKKAIDKETTNEKARNKQVHDSIQEVKNLLKSKDLELIGRIAIRDKTTKKEYR